MARSIRWRGKANCPEVHAFLGMEHDPEETDHSRIYIPPTPDADHVLTARPGDTITRTDNGEYRIN